MAKSKKRKEKEIKEIVKEEKLQKPNLINRIRSMGKKSWLIVLGLVIVIGSVMVFNSYRQAQLAAQSSVQTVQAKIGDLVAIVGATGTVTSNQTADLTWETNGRIDIINAKLNDLVQKDQVLATLDANFLSQNILTARADLVNAQRALEDAQQSATAQANALSNLIKDENDLVAAKTDRDRWNYNNTDWNRIYTARTEFHLQNDKLQIAQNEYNLVSKLPPDNAERKAAREKLAQAQLARDKALRALNLLLGRTYSSEASEDIAKYDVVKAKLDDDRRVWERYIQGPNKDDIAAAQAKLDADQSTSNLAQLSAPFSGTITEVNSKVGDLVINGTISFQIDDLSKLTVTVQIPEVDINSVKVGQRTEITFDAILGKQYNGLVTQISPVGIDSAGVVNFDVTVEFDGIDDGVKPGMTAAVNIIVNEVKNALIVPNRALRLINGTYYITVMKNGQPTQVKIEIGASSDTESQVLSGDVKEGDVVVVTQGLQLNQNSRPPSSVSTTFGG
jgi:HlyD family secretion protein